MYPSLAPAHSSSWRASQSSRLSPRFLTLLHPVPSTCRPVFVGPMETIQTFCLGRSPMCAPFKESCGRRRSRRSHSWGWLSSLLEFCAAVRAVVEAHSFWLDTSVDSKTVQTADSLLDSFKIPPSLFPGCSVTPSLDAVLSCAAVLRLPQLAGTLDPLGPQGVGLEGDSMPRIVFRSANERSEL